jgi:hypothetical protein
MPDVDTPRLTAKAAALLIGENERTVQGWFTRAGHAASRTRDGYPLPIVAEVLADNDRAVPPDVLHREASVTPQRKRRPRRASAIPAPSATAHAIEVHRDPEVALERARNDARMALDALEREQQLSASLAASVAALSGELAALRAAAVPRRRWWQRK